MSCKSLLSSHYCSLLGRFCFPWAVAWVWFALRGLMCWTLGWQHGDTERLVGPVGGVTSRSLLGHCGIGVKVNSHRTPHECSREYLAPPHRGFLFGRVTVSCHVPAHYMTQYTLRSSAAEPMETIQLGLSASKSCELSKSLFFFTFPTSGILL